MGPRRIPNFAEHEFSWFEALGFRMGAMPAARYLGAGALTRTLMTLMGLNQNLPYVVGLWRDGVNLLTPSTMKDAVRAVVDANSDRGDCFAAAPPQACRRSAPKPSARQSRTAHTSTDVTAAYMPAFRTVLGFQACHLNTEFYDRYYRREALSNTERGHLENWHTPNGSSRRTIDG